MIKLITDVSKCIALDCDQVTLSGTTGTVINNNGAQIISQKKKIEPRNE